MRKLFAILSVAILIATGVWGANYVLLQRTLDAVIASDARNAGVQVKVHFRSYVDPSQLAFDVREVSQASMADVFRILLQFAAAVKSRSYDSVVLSSRGVPKFKLEGMFFKRIGEEYGTQNPVYTMRTFPESVRKVDGTAAFETWTGGVLGVLGKQMEDFGSFHRDWYADDVSTQSQSREIPRESLINSPNPA